MVCEESEHLLIVLGKGGFRDRQVVLQPAGYFIQPEDWWTFLWGAAPRERLNRLPPESLGRFRKEVLEEVRSLQDERGIGLTYLP